MRTLWKTLPWLLLLVLLTAGAGGWCAWYGWENQERLLRDTVLTKIDEIMPGLDLHLDSVEFDWKRRVYLRGLSLQVPDQSQPLFQTGEIVVLLNQDRLRESQQVEILELSTTNAILHLNRSADGTWNFQNLPQPKPTSKPLPGWKFEDTTVYLTIEQPSPALPWKAVIKDLDLELIPAGKKVFRLKAGTDIERAGRLEVAGTLDIEHKTWQIEGGMNDLLAGQDLMNLAGETAPELRAKMRELEAQIRQLDPRQLQNGTEVAVVSHPELRVETGPQNVPTLGVTGKVGVQFRLAKPAADQPLEYRLVVNFEQGQIDNPILPFALQDIQGKLFWDNQRLIISDLSAMNGITKIKLGAEFTKQDNGQPGKLALLVSNLVLDERIRQRLPGVIRKIYDPLNARGTLDLSGVFHRDAVGHWRPEGLALQARNCTVQHDLFSYPVHSVNGWINQQDNRLICNFRGIMDQQPIQVAGVVTDPGPGALLDIQARGDNIPLDQRLWNACPPSSHATLDSLQLEGQASGIYTLSRRAGETKLQHDLAVTMQNCALEYKKFRYPITNLSGKINFSTRTSRWDFLELKGMHGAATIQGAGRFYKEPDKLGQLRLGFRLREGTLDKQLQLALPEKMQRIWDDFSPTGEIEELETWIDWTQGGEVAVELRSLSIREGTFRARAFPYPMEGVNANISYKNGLVNIGTFSGKHDETRLRGRGFYELTELGDWRLRIEEFYLDDLMPDRLLREALPTGLRSTIEQLNPREKTVSASGMFELRGTTRPEDPLTAAWDIETVFNGGTITAGIDLKNLRGPITSRGQWDGQNLKLSGELKLDAVTLKDYQLTQIHGPYQLNNNQLIAGSRVILLTDPTKPQTVQPFVHLEERISAKAIGGTITVDAFVNLAKQPEYRVKMTVNQGLLEEYARRYMPGTRNLSGVINGWVDLYGQAGNLDKLAGVGQIQVSPAAIYELPVVFQIFRTMTTPRPNTTAFKYAFADFNIQRSQVNFKVIDLVGDSLSLRGQGWVHFDSRLAIDFYSRLARNQNRIPIVSQLIQEVSSDWVRVEVRGRVNAPQVRNRPVPHLDDAVRRMLGTFDPRNAPLTIPRLLVPPIEVPPETQP